MHGHFDNSESNLNNPNPKATVHWGDQTWEEMMIGFYDIAVQVSQSDIQRGKLPTFQPGPEEFAKRMIERFDKNHDGKIDTKELPLSKPGVPLFFFSVDKNHDGFITEDELVTMLKERQEKGGRGGAGLGALFGPRRPCARANGTHAEKPANHGEQKPADPKQQNGKDQASAN